MATVSPARAALRSALKVVMPAHTKGAASSDLSSSGMRASARASAIIISAYPPSLVTPVIMGFWQYAVSPRRQVSQVPSSPPKNPTPTRWPTFQVVTRRPTSSMRQLLHGPAHADTRRRAVVPQRCPRLSDIHRKPLPGYVLVPHPARRQASRRGEKSQVWLSRPPYMFFPFSSPIDLEELMCRRSQELRKRQVENSPLLAILALCRETELGRRTPL